MQSKIVFVLIQFSIFLGEHHTFIHAKALVGKNITDAVENQYPFLVSVGIRHRTCGPQDRHTCTGTLISRWHVLTAAHCVANRRVLNVVMGSVDLQQGKSIMSEKWIDYDQWADANNKTKQFTKNDIAIIKLKEEVTDETIKPAIVWNRTNEDLFGRHAVLAGWGITNNATTISRVLRVGHVKIISNRICAQYRVKYDPVYRLITEQYICSNAKPYVLLGPGDCGGPIIIKKHVIVGVSTGSCVVSEEMKQRLRGVEDYQVNLHASVSAYKDFIDWGLAHF